MVPYVSRHGKFLENRFSIPLLANSYYVLPFCTSCANFLCGKNFFTQNKLLSIQLLYQIDFGKLVIDFYQIPNDTSLCIYKISVRKTTVKVVLNTEIISSSFISCCSKYLERNNIGIILEDDVRSDRR